MSNTSNSTIIPHDIVGTHKKQKNEEDFLVRLDKKLEKRIEDIKSEKTVPEYTAGEQEQEYINVVGDKFKYIVELIDAGKKVPDDKLLIFKEVERYLVLTNNTGWGEKGYTNYTKYVMTKLNGGDDSILYK